MRVRVSERDAPTAFIDLFKESKTLIKWTDNEYQQFAEQVWEERSERPFLAQNKLFERAQLRLLDEGSWEVDRLRLPSSIASAGHERVESLLKEIYREAKDVRADRAELKREPERAVSSPTKEEILDKLTDEEVMVFFGQRVLEQMQPQDIIEAFSPQELLSMVPTDQLMGCAASRLTSDLLVQLSQLARGVMPI